MRWKSMPTPKGCYLAAAGQTGQHSSYTYPIKADTYKILAYLPRYDNRQSLEMWVSLHSDQSDEVRTFK